MIRHVRTLILAGLSISLGTAAAAATGLLPLLHAAPPSIRHLRPVVSPDLVPKLPPASAPTAHPSPSATDVRPVKATQEESDGALATADGTLCPLSHTDVQAEITGFVARVTVTQQFINPTNDRIEAIYTFPLPHDAAVDDMTMTVGERVVRGLIKRREEAQKIYEQARAAGHTTALLEQERPNIFTQSVANIPPHSPVTIKITYIELLDYDEGRYSFVFPMVVGPRYIPGQPTGATGGGWAQDTTRVPDASRITPPVAGVHFGRKGTRAGHDISLAVKLDAGVAIQTLQSVTHETDIDRPNAHAAVVSLRNAREIPNRDFALTFDTSGARIQDAVLTHAPGGKDGYFAFILQPPDRVTDEDATPRELVFVLDTSGSMSGYPIETAKKVMRRAIGSLRAGDTFNLITFAGDTRILFPEPVEATSRNVQRALEFLDGQAGGGGTEMMAAIRAALGDRSFPLSGGIPEDGRIGMRRIGHATGGNPDIERPDPANRVRVVCFMTDGYVGNDMEVIGEVKKHPAARVFSFGIGSSVNRFLLDGMARAGRGEVEYVLRAEDAESAADRFYERVHTPILTDVALDFGSLPVSDLTPAQTPDLFAARPVVVAGRYHGSGSGTVTLRGLRGGRPFSRKIAVTLPAREPRHQSLGQLWARRTIEDLTSQDWIGAQSGQVRTDLREKITQLGLTHRLMTAFTAFVAVEERTIVEGGRQRTIQVPVEMPHNVSPEGVFGDHAQVKAAGGFATFAPAVGGAAGNTAGVSPSQRTRNQPVPAAPPPSRSSRQESADARRDSARDEDARTSLRDGPREALESKLHPSIMKIFECYERAGGVQQSLAACTVDADGRVAVKVWLTRAGDASVMRRLSEAGFIPNATLRAVAPGSPLEGRIEIARLPELASIADVTLVSSPGK
jgi:Ca-activated chloride channel family protein